MAEQPVRLAVDGRRWQPLLEWLRDSPLLVRSLHLHGIYGQVRLELCLSTVFGRGSLPQYQGPLPVHAPLPGGCASPQRGMGRHRSVKDLCLGCDSS